MKEELPVIVYACVFNFLGGMMTAHSTRGISMFASGFWVDRDGIYRDGSAGEYWIAPAAIRYIKKEIDAPALPSP